MGVVLQFRRNPDRYATKWPTPIKYSRKIPVWIFVISTKPHGGRLLLAIICKWRSLTLFFVLTPWTVNGRVCNMKSCQAVKIIGIESHSSVGIYIKVNYAIF